MTNLAPKVRWYVVNVYSGFEKKVAESIQEQAVKKGLDQQILNVMVPTEEVIEMKRGEKVTKEKNYFPGYILVQMALSDESWHLISQTAKVTGFLGGKGKPTPVAQKEVDRLLGQLEDQKGKPKHAYRYEIGDHVRVVEGPFSTFTGIVEEVEDDKERLKVAVIIFGRPTPVELGFAQVDKLS